MNARAELAMKREGTGELLAGKLGVNAMGSWGWLRLKMARRRARGARQRSMYACLKL